MAVPVWPSDLPTYTLLDGYSERPYVPRASFPSDVGPPIERPRGTYRMRDIRVSMLMTPSQFVDFEEFFFDDLGQGVEPFDGPHPRTGDTVRMKIKSDEGTPYVIEMDGSDSGDGMNITVSLILTVLGQ